MNLWRKLQEIGILKRDAQTDIAAECRRFKADQAFQQYIDAARFNIIEQLTALSEDNIDEFKQLKRSQMALDGFEHFMDAAITTEMMKERAKAAS